MNGWRTLFPNAWYISAREFRCRARSRSFIIGTVILAVIPPTDRGQNEAFPKIGSLKERIDARNLLNVALEKYCRPLGFAYLDPFGPFEDSNGALKAEMSDGNVHCGPAYAPLIVEKVMQTCAPWIGPPAG